NVRFTLKCTTRTIGVSTAQAATARATDPASPLRRAGGFQAGYTTDRTHNSSPSCNGSETSPVHNPRTVAASASRSGATDAAVAPAAAAELSSVGGCPESGESGP